MGFSEGDNPSVSGLNIGSFGIDMNNSGISHIKGVTGTQSYTISSDNTLDITAKDIHIRATDGLGHLIFYTGDQSDSISGLDIYNRIKAGGVTTDFWVECGSGGAVPAG